MLIIYGANNKTPISTAEIDTIITAPAAMSFAIPTILEYLLWKIASSENSIAELNISAEITAEIVNNSMQNFVTEKWKQNAIASTKAAISKWTLILRSLLKVNLMPLRAFLKVFEKFCFLYFVINNPYTFQSLLLVCYNEIKIFLCLVVKPQ